jgi:hypothetical protein
LTSEEEIGVRVFERVVLGRIFGYKTDEVSGVWGVLRIEELHNLYTLPNVNN